MLSGAEAERTNGLTFGEIKEMEKTMSKEKTQTAVSSLSFTAPETCFYRADSTALKVKFSFLSQTNLAENLFQMSQVCFLHHLFGLDAGAAAEARVQRAAGGGRVDVERQGVDVEVLHACDALGAGAAARTRTQV